MIDDAQAAHQTAEEGLEINAELTAALAVLLGEPPPEPCSPGCRTPHLSAKADEAVREALGRWRARESRLAELEAEVGELEGQFFGNWVIRQMRGLRQDLKARGLWRPAGQGEPGGGTAGSAIEAIDRLTTELAEARASARHNAEGWEEGRKNGVKLAEAEALVYAGEVVRRDWIPISPYYICRTIADRIKKAANEGQPGEANG